MLSYQNKWRKAVADAEAISEQLHDVETALGAATDRIRLLQSAETRAEERADGIMRHFSTVLVALASQLLVPEDVVEGLLAADSEVFGTSMRRCGVP